MGGGPRLALPADDFAQFRHLSVDTTLEMQSLKEQAASGEIELAYLDEAGFSAVHPTAAPGRSVASATW